METNSNANFDTCSERIKFTKHFNMNCCCDVLSMTSACALRVRLVNYEEVKLLSNNTSSQKAKH